MGCNYVAFRMGIDVWRVSLMLSAVFIFLVIFLLERKPNDSRLERRDFTLFRMASYSVAGFPFVVWLGLLMADPFEYLRDIFGSELPFAWTLGSVALLSILTAIVTSLWTLIRVAKSWSISSRPALLYRALTLILALHSIAFMALPPLPPYVRN